MTRLLDVTQVRLAPELLEHTHETLRKIGEDLVEGLVLWAGRKQGSLFRVETVIRPSQHAVRSEAGLSVRVDRSGIHQVNAYLYKHGMELVAQVHSHPGEAYHSALDDAIPLVTTIGGLSLVVPDFARGPVDVTTYAAYRLSAVGKWEEVEPTALAGLIHVTPNSSSSSAR